MRTKDFVSKLEHARIVAAIERAELKSSGEIRVHIERGNISGDPLALATKKFQETGMHKTRHRNAVLIFVAPRAQSFAIVGDEAVHQKCGDAYWRQITEAMRAHFLEERFTEALVEAIRDVGAVLAEHFPHRPDDTNELPDSVIES